ncbi:MAG: 1-(5-phosphoribosyl)-5-[(5-phosphoribosylamino)methylideneamino]imidazole-4-carboxamide isomerase [Alphaproteobacteria bacterium]|nr:1-(5-phosphoribosyl)-5-[(5-phosphoribosylamino)methylideneamino]imidazole-4-carboxamide isomerase [Alphaproteobacteria bacterium]
MILYPAIDIKDGRCVRLVEGRYDAETVFNEDPGSQATAFEAAGFSWIHAVDLNGALDGRPGNAAAFASIVAATSLPVQIGGGVRDRAALEAWLSAGATRVILGTIAARDPDFVHAAAKDYPGRIAVGIDARDGKVAVQGWTETTDILALDLARRFEDAGVACLIVTDIARDGKKTGVNVAFTGAIADAVSIPVIASGGVKSIEDIAALKARAGVRPIHGAILGRALYDGDIDPRAALAQAAS